MWLFRAVSGRRHVIRGLALVDITFGTEFRADPDRIGLNPQSSWDSRRTSSLIKPQRCGLMPGA